MGLNRVLAYKGAVQTHECDSNRHMNVMYYINKFELAGRTFLSECGLSREYLQENKIGVAVVEHLVQYRKEVFEDDILVIHSQTKECQRKIFTVFHEMFNSETDELSATMMVKFILFDLNSRKSIQVPKHLEYALTTNAEEAS